MTIELTEQQRRLVEEQAGRPIEVVDPDGRISHMIIPKEQFERVRSVLENSASGAEPSSETFEIPPGIRRSQEAFWRELPELLKQKKFRGKRVCYHGDERIGIAKDSADLYEICRERGINKGEFYVGYIGEREAPPWEPLVLEESLFEWEDVYETDPSAKS